MMDTVSTDWDEKRKRVFCDSEVPSREDIIDDP